MGHSSVWLANFVLLLSCTVVFGEFLLPDDTKVDDTPLEESNSAKDDVNPFAEFFDWGDLWGHDDSDNDENTDEYYDVIDRSEEDADNIIDGDGNSVEESEDITDSEGTTTETYAVDVDEDDDSDDEDDKPFIFDKPRNRKRNPFLENVARMQENHRRINRLIQRGLHGQLDINPFLNVGWDLRLLADRNRWWNGPNICKREEEDEKEPEETSSIIRHYMVSKSVCDDTGTVYKCTTEVKMPSKTKMLSVIYECCPGFERVDNSPGCAKGIPLLPLKETLQHLNATDLLHAIETITMAEYMDQGNFTVFAPINGIFSDFSPIQNTEANVVVVTPGLVELAKELEETIMAHIVPYHVKTSYMQDEDILPTLSQGNNIRINIYKRPLPLVTANCHRIISSDHMASNGVVHLVDGILKPIKDSIAGIISKQPDLSMFKSVLGQSGMLSILKKRGDYTLFVPSNTAFDRMHPDLKDKLISGQQCVQDVINQHLINNVICSNVLAGEISTINVLNNRLNITRSTDDKLFVNGAQVLETDVMATNGVIHIIDDVLIPDEALTLLDVVRNLDADTFLGLVEVSGLTKKLIQMHNFTLFLPSSEAFEKLPEEEIRRLMANREELANRLLYHMIPSTESTADLGDKSSHDTLLDGQKLNVRTYKNFPFGLMSLKLVQCAKFEQTDIGVCGGVIHTINKVLDPPSGNVFDAIQNNQDLSEFARLLQSTGIADALHHNRVYTVFAPTNRALGALGSETMKFLGENPDRLRQFLQHHIADDAICCSGMFDDILSETRATLDGSVVLTGRRGNQHLVNQVTIVKCDVMANNGIVHVIDRILPEALNKYVTRHMRHHGNMNLHMHNAGDQFGRGLEDYVMNILGEWFGPKGPHNADMNSDILAQFQIHRDQSDRRERGRNRRPKLTRGHNPNHEKQERIKERLIQQRRGNAGSHVLATVVDSNGNHRDHPRRHSWRGQG